jgi:hypothetical protein
MKRNQVRYIIGSIFIAYGVLIAIAKSIDAHDLADDAQRLADDTAWQVRELESEVEDIERELRYGR